MDYVRQVKKAYPQLWVEAVNFGPSEDGKSIFAAFEGLATDTTPLFKGVDLFRFNDDVSRIVEVEGVLDIGCPVGDEVHRRALSASLAMAPFTLTTPTTVPTHTPVYRSNWQGAKGHEQRKKENEGKKPSPV